MDFVRCSCSRGVRFLTLSPSEIIVARTVVLREVLEESFVFFTDRRSPKVRQLELDSRCCVHAYDTENRLQLQLYGSCSVVDNHPKLIHWQQLGMRRFEDYGSCVAPGTVLSNTHEVSEEVALKQFAVLLFCIDCIELLKLRREGHWRVRWSKDGDGWRVTELVP